MQFRLRPGSSLTWSRAPHRARLRGLLPAILLLTACASPHATPPQAAPATSAQDQRAMRAMHAARLPVATQGDLLISVRQVQAAMLAHNRGTGNRSAMLFCVEHLRLGSHIPIATCGTTAQLTRAGLMHARDLPRLLRQQARRAGEPEAGKPETAPGGAASPGEAPPAAPGA